MAWTSAKSAADRDEMIRWLFENSRDLMHVIGPDGRFKLTNAAWKQLAGWEESDLAGASALEFFHSEDTDALRASIRALAVGEVSESQIRARLKDGGYHWFAARTQKVADGSLIVTMRDNTDERARTEELIEVRRTRRLLSEAAGVGAWSFEPLEDRIEWSQDLLTLTGFTAEDIATPELFQARVHPADRKKTTEIMAHSVATGEPGQLQHRMKVGGRWRTYRTTFRLVGR